MKPDAKRIKDIYSGSVVRHYDLPISHMFKKYKVQAFKDSSLKPGDKVLVFCCGTGLDFAPILDKIGDEGHITGIDFSKKMLAKAEKRIAKNKWKNVELTDADVTTYQSADQELFDVGVCTLGLSIIPEYRKAYTNLMDHIKTGGEVIIGDAQLATNRYSRFNPLTILMAKHYGGSYEGHQNTLKICESMKQELQDVRKREFFLKSYFYSIGKKP